MKSGIAEIMFALRALREANHVVSLVSVKVWLVSDEEEGSDSPGRSHGAVALQCEAEFVCEPAGPGGALKTARKGVGGSIIKVMGRGASHAGLDFEKEESVTLEGSHQIQAVSRPHRSASCIHRPGTSASFAGGSRTNVVPRDAAAEVDLRIAR